MKTKEQCYKEYLERMEKSKRTGKGISTDYLMDCPFCGGYRMMEREGYYWRCLSRACSGRIHISELGGRK